MGSGSRDPTRGGTPRISSTPSRAHPVVRHPTSPGGDGSDANADDTDDEPPLHRSEECKRVLELLVWGPGRVRVIAVTGPRGCGKSHAIGWCLRVSGAPHQRLRIRHSRHDAPHRISPGNSAVWVEDAGSWPPHRLTSLLHEASAPGLPLGCITPGSAPPGLTVILECCTEGGGHTYTPPETAASAPASTGVCLRDVLREVLPQTWGCGGGSSPAHTGHAQRAPVAALRAALAVLPVAAVALRHYSTAQLVGLARPVASQALNAHTPAGTRGGHPHCDLLQSQSAKGRAGGGGGGGGVPTVEALQRYVSQRIGSAGTAGPLGDGTPERGGLLLTRLPTVHTLRELADEGVGGAARSDFSASSAAEQAVDLAVELAQGAPTKRRRVVGGSGSVSRIAAAAADVATSRPLLRLAVALPPSTGMGLATALDEAERRGTAVRLRAGAAYRPANSAARVRAARLGLLELLPE